MGNQKLTREKECRQILLLCVTRTEPVVALIVTDLRLLGPETFPDLTYIIQMRRRPLFYVFNMILPCFLITTVAFLGFCVPSDSGTFDRLV